MRLRDENLTWREIDGETVLLDLAGSKYLTVNAAGTGYTGQVVYPAV